MFQPLEIRAAVELRTAGGRKLQGYAAVFHTPARIGNFTETIAPGAFRASLASGQDTLALLDHDAAKVLARTRNGSLRLSEDARGLAFELDAPDTSTGRDVLAMVESGLVGGCSFGFRVNQERWTKVDQRELIEVQLAEISIVSAFPAYSQTSVHARSRGTIVLPPHARRRLLVVL